MVFLERMYFSITIIIFLNVLFNVLQKFFYLIALLFFYGQKILFFFPTNKPEQI